MPYIPTERFLRCLLRPSTILTRPFTLPTHEIQQFTKAIPYIFPPAFI